MPYRQDADWQRLAEYAKARREELGLTQRDAAVRANLSTNGYRGIEDGSAVRASTLDAAERALGWAAGSAKAVLHGGEPTEDRSQVSVGSSTPGYALPAGLRAALAHGEVIDVAIRPLVNGDDNPLGSIVTIGIVHPDIPDSELMAAIAAFRAAVPS